jgi:hypothetical protein
MLGDSTNNILFARLILARGGIGIGPKENPVPLPSALMAIVMADGRGTVPAHDLFKHDIQSFAIVWSILIVLTCITAGAMAGSIVRATGTRPFVVAIVSGGASLVPLSWLFTGYPIQFGFFNVHVAMPIVFIAFTVYFRSEKQPAIVIALLTVAATLLLAVWSPLVLMPASLGVVVLIRCWRRLVATRGAPLWIALIGIAQFTLYGLLVVVPSYLTNSGFLSQPGGVVAFRKWMIIGLAIATIGLAVAAFRVFRDLVVLGAIAIVAASAVGLAALLFLSRNEPTPWTYYPIKFSWLSSTVLVIVIVGLAAATVVRYCRAFLIQCICLAIVACGTFGFLNWAPTSVFGVGWADPIPLILKGQVMGKGDTAADTIFQLATPERAHVLWHSGDPDEPAINFWLMQLWSNTMDLGVPLKSAAYGLYDHDDVHALCQIIGWMGGNTIVHTSLSDLMGSLQAECPALRPLVVVRNR